ncbi:MAG: YraN family protein [Candidatus Omnitrophota bacterium]|jgi:putative endonuclease
MVSEKSAYLGGKGEQAAASLLKENGYKILFTNYKTRLGEIDIIAEDRGTICFIEVKARSSDRFGSPSEAVSLLKQRKISEAALLFLKERKLLDKRARFDVVSVYCSRDGQRLELIRDAFELNDEFTF